MSFVGSDNVIAIAGAGIAGLSAAIALRLAGFEIEIYEREPELRTIGAGIQLGPNATRILQQWDVAFEGCEPTGIQLRNAHTGRLLNTIPLNTGTRDRYFVPYVTLLRSALQESLLARAQELDIPINFGAPIDAASDRGSRVEIEAGGSREEVTALIGADGLKSGVRVSPAPFFTGTVAWRSLLPARAVAAPLSGVIAAWMGRGAHLVHYPVNADTQNAVLLIDGPAASENETAPPSSLAERLSSWADAALAIIAGSDAWQPWNLFAVPGWNGGNGRVQYIGDAWHAMVPYLASGAVMAIEDAAVLAASFAVKTNNIPEALTLFRQKRKRRVWRVARSSARMGRIYHLPPPLDSIRDLIIRNVTGEMLLARNNWLYGYRAESCVSREDAI